MQFDHVHPDHHGPNTVHMTRVQIAKIIVQAGHRRVLDLPCGTGALTQMLLDGGVEAVSADLDPTSFVVPRHSCVRADLNARLPFEDGEFDAMACIEGIEHIENPHLLAREANRILRMGGRVYVSTPNVLSLRSRLSMIEVDAATGGEKPIAHINPVGFLELRYIFSRWGFRVDEVQTNRQMKKGSPFYQILRFLLRTRGKRAAATHPRIAEVRKDLLSDAVLFGEGLILGATKVADCPR